MRSIWLFALTLFFAAHPLQALSQSDHPRILVSGQDKREILRKIQDKNWARHIYDEMTATVEPYVERHRADPEWILSRYQMNWQRGSYYTDHYSPSGTELTRWEGNAPHPTVRVPTHKRHPVAPDGYRYRTPSLEEVQPYDTDSLWHLQSTGPDGDWSRAEPRRIVGNINARINDLALQSAILHWLTGEEKYAAFASDILFQWARGAYYQNPVSGACRTGFLGIQSLGDRQYSSLVLAYDFVHDYLHAAEYDTQYFQPVFEKMAHTAMERGFWSNNWYAAQAPLMVYAALMLDDESQRDHYLSYYLERDTTEGSCGQLGLPTTMAEHFTHDGHWKENPAYHSMPVGALLKAAVAVENNGTSVFEDHPALFKASYAMLRYSFPNLRIMGYGDSKGWKNQSAQNLEIAIRFASEYDHPALPGLTASLNQLIEAGRYERKKSGWFGLLTYLAAVPDTQAEAFAWDRAMAVDFARLYGHRNGTDRETGLMHYVQGATYNHNHANGMAIELYGRGYVMGTDPGTAGYDEDVSINYYAVFAAHNTVIAAGASEPSRPFTGSGGQKHMGEISRSVMEPAVGQEAVSPHTSFVETNYREPSTDTNQQRTVGIVRTSEETGYYVDFFRSDNEISNDYLYHNIGHSVTLSDLQRNPLEMKPSVLRYREDRQTGMALFEEVAAPVSAAPNAVATFRVEETGDDAFMQMLTSMQAGREVFTAVGPRTRTAPERLQDLPTPVVVVHQEGAAWDEPFAAVYEPFRGEDGYSVLSARTLDTGSPLSVLEVANRNGSRQLIMQSDQPGAEYSADSLSIKGHYGVVSLDSENRLQYIYLGQGEAVHWNAYRIESTDPDNAIFVELGDDTITVSSIGAFTMTFPYRIGHVTDEQGNVMNVDPASSRSVVDFTPGTDKQYRISR